MNVRLQKSLAMRAGFTLIELLVVIAIIGILASVILASLNSARSKARDAQRLESLKQVQTALELYRDDHPGYPYGNANTLALWQSDLTTWLVTPGYLPAVPVDPGSNIYRYYSAFSTTYTCDGLPWQNYEYVIIFDLENPNSSVPTTNWATSKYCFHGPTK